MEICTNLGIMMNLNYIGSLALQIWGMATFKKKKKVLILFSPTGEFR